MANAFQQMALTTNASVKKATMDLFAKKVYETLNVSKYLWYFKKINQFSFRRI
jgi:hypothetical protein